MDDGRPTRKIMLPTHGAMIAAARHAAAIEAERYTSGVADVLLELAPREKRDIFEMKTASDVPRDKGNRRQRRAAAAKRRKKT